MGRGWRFVYKTAAAAAGVGWGEINNLRCLEGFVAPDAVRREVDHFRLDAEQGQDDKGKVIIRGNHDQVAGISGASVRAAAVFSALCILGQASHLRADEILADRVRRSFVFGSRADGYIKILVLRL